MKYSLALWLTVCLAGLQFAAVTIVVLSSYFTSERVLLDHARGLLSDVGINTTEHSKGFLNPARGAAELAARLAENKIVSSENSQQLERLLFQQLQTAPQFAGVFYGDEAGNFVYVNRSDEIGPFRSKLIANTGDTRRTELIWRGKDFEVLEAKDDPSDSFDPRARPWYMSAQEELRSIWTDPYIFFSSQQPGITIASPVIDGDGAVVGVVGVDIEISAISDFLGRLEIGENGTALIVHQNGDVIAHPQSELLKAQRDDGTYRFVNIGEIADPVAKIAFGDVTTNTNLTVEKETYAEFTYEGEPYVALVMPTISAELPWTIAIYAPERDFIGAIKDNRFQNIWIAFGVAVLTGVMGLILSNILSRPIRAFSVRAALVSQGEIDEATPLPKTYKELETANEALNQQIKKRKETEREYGLTFDMASRGMVQIDTQNGTFLRVNDKFADILGYSVSEILDKNPADLTHPDDPAVLWDAGADLLEDQAINLEKRCIRKDGEVVWVKVNAIMIRDSDGKLLHAVATVDDITETRAAEQQITKLSRDLSHFARGDLLGQMAAGLAHELNQPLTAITQNVDAALQTVSETDDADKELVQILGDLDQQAHRAADIIRALRGFARKGEEWKVPFDLEELIRQSLRLVRAETTEHGVDVSVDAKGLPKIVGMRVQVAQVIVNLLRNSVDSIAQSGRNLKQIVISASVVEDTVQVTVEDSGAGIDPSIDLFGQFETTKSDGMGLGLSICRSIVEAGGGKMWHDNTCQAGARMCFTIPIETA